MTKINRVLISGDDNMDYMKFLPIVSLAWEKMLGTKPTLALVTNNPEKYSWAKDLCQDVVFFPIDYSLPDAKSRSFVARMLIRCKFNGDICMVSDLDMIPLQSEIFHKSMDDYRYGLFVSIGYNVMQNGDGDPQSTITDPLVRKFPSCYTIASSYIWSDIINPNRLSDVDLVNSWRNISYFDHKESVNKSNFCDESLMRALIQKWDSNRINVVGVDRPMRGRVILDRVDRNSWNIDRKKLLEMGYVDAHCPRTSNLSSDSVLEDIFQFIGKK